MIESIVMGGAYFVGVFMGRWSKKSKAPSHDHIWKVTACENFSEVNSSSSPTLGRRKTKVLMTCFCGGFDVKILDGTWSKEDLSAL